MIRIARLGAAITIAVLASSRPVTADVAQLPADPAIRSILQDRIDKMHQGVGVVVGIVTPAGRRIISYGTRDAGDSKPLDGDTVFEVGSVTKIFTALLLADMVSHGLFTLNEPVATCLPQQTLPERNGKAITFLDLATHTSGLPFLPANFGPPDTPVSYQRYTAADLDSFLAAYQLPHDIGTNWEYSNLGYGLLGMALAACAHMPYENLLDSHVVRVLGMHETGIRLSARMRAALAPGHTKTLARAPQWQGGIFNAAGSLRSSANDMLTFLAAAMALHSTPLRQPMDLMIRSQRPGNSPAMTQALGWWILRLGADDPGIVTFGGETFGDTSALAYDPQTKTGVVVLSNSAWPVADIAWHLLRPNFPLTVQAPPVAPEVSVDARALDRYAGSYRDPNGITITIARNGPRLTFESSSSPGTITLYATAPTEFSAHGIDLHVSFQLDASGAPLSVTVKFGGFSSVAKRV